MWVLLAFRPSAWMSSKCMKTLKSKITNVCGFLLNSLRFKMKSHLLKNRSAVAVIYCCLNLTTVTEDSFKVETLYCRQIKSVAAFFLVVIYLLHILKSAGRSTLRILSSCENSVDIVISVLTPRDVWQLTVGDSSVLRHYCLLLRIPRRLADTAASGHSSCGAQRLIIVSLSTRFTVHNPPAPRISSRFHQSFSCSSPRPSFHFSLLSLPRYFAASTAFIVHFFRTLLRRCYFISTANVLMSSWMATKSKITSDFVHYVVVIRA